MRINLNFSHFLLISLLVWGGCGQEDTANAGSAIVESPIPSAAAQTVSLAINLDKIGSPTAETKYTEGMTVGQLIDQQLFIKMQLKAYAGMGRLVTGINGIENQATPDHYWQYCINGTVSNLGIDEKKLAASDRVEWHYVTYGETPCKKIGE